MSDSTFQTQASSGAAGGASAPIGKLILKVESGPDAGLSFTLDDQSPNRVMIGRSAACEVRLSDPSVSARHAAICLEDGVVVLEDLGSRNGTTLGGVPVFRAPLRGGEGIGVGGSVLLLRPAHEPAKAQTPDGLPTVTSFGRVIGGSREMRRVYVMAQRLAQSDVPILIEGETGTGKEAMAEAIHEASPRAKKSFQVFDCTTVPNNLMESVLFGHERGAFTGATETRQGLLETADGGTLLIDEIGDMDLTLQPKLLRVLEKQEFRRVGGNKVIKTNVRLLSATRRNLDREVEEGRFRDDLFHRLAVTRIELPPLRARKGDLGLLVRGFVATMQGDESLFDEDLMRRWEAAPWPGNVRELRNAVARRLALGELGDSVEYLSPAERTAQTPQGLDAAVTALAQRMMTQGRPLHEVREHMIEVLEACYLRTILAQHGGNVTRAAQAAGVTRRHMHRMLARRGT
jgi:DNA-binding NtrC family response regulator